MTQVEVFDPAQCCSSGVCGPSVDLSLVRFAAALESLKRQGVEVIRHNLSQNPAAFAAHPAVSQALKDRGVSCLPLIVVDGQVWSQGSYPDATRVRGLSQGVSPMPEPRVDPTHAT